VSQNSLVSNKVWHKIWNLEENLFQQNFNEVSFACEGVWLFLAEIFSMIVALVQAVNLVFSCIFILITLNKIRYLQEIIDIAIPNKFE